MAQDRVPLFVRVPVAQAQAIDELVQVSGRRKQEVVSELLSARLGVGRIDLSSQSAAEPGDVLTLAELAALLRVPPAWVAARAVEGELPGRRLDGDWRFSRAAVMAWLAAGEGAVDVRADDG